MYHALLASLGEAVMLKKGHLRRRHLKLPPPAPLARIVHGRGLG